MQAATGDREEVATILCKTCDHRKRHLSYTAATGEKVTVFARHLPLQGRKTEGGRWATASAAIYPAELNRALAKAITVATKSKSHCSVLS
eukprot:6455461-Amphidinium_carterae.1